MRTFTMPVLAAALLLVAGCAADARRVHERLLTLDTHLDTPALLAVEGWNITDRHSVSGDGSQVDLPRMIDGGLDGGFWVTFIAQGPLTPEGRAAARDAALRRVGQIRDMVAANPGHFEVALTPEDAPRIAAAGRRFVFLSMENGYPFGEDLSLLGTFHALGVRIAAPVHFMHNDLGSSATDLRPVPWRGLSPLGERWVAEANRLGILIDASHASDAVLGRLLDLSRAPLILTHTGARAVFDHPRNIDDALLRRVAAQGGVVQVPAFSAYLVVERRANFEDFMQHLLHVIRVAGVAHTGIGIDFDGGGGVDGLDEASDYPRITQRLLAEGYSQADLQRIWSGNALRVLGLAQQCARLLAADAAAACPRR